MMPDTKKKVEYNHVQYEERVPFAAYCDFECMMVTKQREEHHGEENRDDDSDGDVEQPTAPKTPRCHAENTDATQQLHSSTTSSSTSR
jgi:hypothetical protein